MTGKMYLSLMYTAIVINISIYQIYSTPISARAQLPSLSADNSENRHNAQPAFGTDCPQCYRTHNVSVTEEELRAIRIEYIKQKILKKLNMAHPPIIPASERKFNFSASPMFGQLEGLQGDQPIDDVEESTEETIFISGHNGDKCVKHIHRKPSVCMYFKLAQIKKHMKLRELKSVTLFAWREPDINDAPYRKQTYVIRELENKGVLKAGIRIASRSLGTGQKLEMKLSKTIIEKMIRRKSSKFRIEVSCKTCGNSEDQYPIKTSEGNVTIAFKFGKFRHGNRNKRSIRTCQPGQTDCCAEDLSFSFREAGWDFIREPQTFHTKFCKGSCDNVALPEIAHTQVLRRANREETRVEICCSPTKLAPISVLYERSMDSHFYEELQDMRVVRCGCEY